MDSDSHIRLLKMTGPHLFGLLLRGGHWPPHFQRRRPRWRSLWGVDSALGSIAPAHAYVVIAYARATRVSSSSCQPVFIPPVLVYVADWLVTLVIWTAILVGARPLLNLEAGIIQF